MPATVGSKAPDVVLHLHDGTTTKLSDFEQKQSVVLFFYPKDNTPVCTSEACSFRDAYPNFAALDAVATAYGPSLFISFSDKGGGPHVDSGSTKFWQHVHAGRKEWRVLNVRDWPRLFATDDNWRRVF